MHAVFRPVQRKLTVEACHELARTGHPGADCAQRAIAGPGDDARIAALPGLRIPLTEVFG